MNRKEFQIKRTKIISNMLENPDAYGIYPTTECFNELDKLYDEVVNYLTCDRPDEIEEISDAESEAWANEP